MIEKRLSSKNERYRLLRTFLFVLGAYTFTICMGLILHEYGHAIIQKISGFSDIEVFLHPFDMSFVTNSSQSQFPKETLLAPIQEVFPAFLNTLTALFIMLIFWPNRKVVVIPLLMIGATSFLQESVGIIIDLSGGGDWKDFVMLTGTSTVAVISISLVLLIIGIIFMFLIMPLMGIRHNESFMKRLIQVLGIPAYFGISVVYISIFGSKYSDISRILMARAIATAASLLLVILIAALYKAFYKLVSRISYTDVKEVSWKHSFISISLGVLIVSVMILNY